MSYFLLLELMNSSGRRTTLKYQRKVSNSPMTGNPMWPGGSRVPVPEYRNLSGAAYQSSFHHHNNHPSNGKAPKIKANHTPLVLSILKLKRSIVTDNIYFVI